MKLKLNEKKERCSHPATGRAKTTFLMFNSVAFSPCFIGSRGNPVESVSQSTSIWALLQWLWLYFLHICPRMANLSSFGSNYCQIRSVRGLSVRPIFSAESLIATSTVIPREAVIPREVGNPETDVQCMFHELWCYSVIKS